MISDGKDSLLRAEILNLLLIATFLVIDVKSNELDLLSKNVDALYPPYSNK